MKVTKTTMAGWTGARKGVRRALAVAGLAAVLLAGTAVPAHASHWTLTDGFGGNPAGRWSPTVNGTGGGVFSNVAQWSHSGSWHAYRWIDSAGSGASSSYIRRNVHADPVAGTAGQFYFCNASIWLTAVQAPALGYFQVRDAGTGATLKTAITQLVPSQGWQRVWLGDWDPDGPDMVIRAGVIEFSGQSGVADVRIDDLYVICQRVPF